MGERVFITHNLLKFSSQPRLHLSLVAAACILRPAGPSQQNLYRRVSGDYWAPDQLGAREGREERMAIFFPPLAWA